MQVGELRRFRSFIAHGADYTEGSTFMVLRVNAFRHSGGIVDILLDGRIEESLGYFWVEDNSEVLNESR
jgi:hypothetical protein